MLLLGRGGLGKLLLVLAGATACSEAPNVTLRTATPDDALLPASATRVELAASRDGRRVGFSTADYSPGVTLSLEANTPADGLSLTVTVRDATSTAVAYGTASPEVTQSINDADGDCCITLCLCEPAIHDAGDCSCGSRSCVSCEGS